MVLQFEAAVERASNGGSGRCSAIVVVLLLCACGGPHHRPPECQPSVICPGATSIDLDAAVPPFHFPDGGLLDGSWWLCVCDGYGALWHLNPDAYDWGKMTEAQVCVVYRREWVEWCPLADAGGP
jgi:hypothetical protein